ncbi:hypothetical protein GW17_00056297 [Ensete ventricosum]|nr:hypothetical protein GW17_00056297 [Ensete ventricosum]
MGRHHAHRWHLRAPPSRVLPLPARALCSQAPPLQAAPPSASPGYGLVALVGGLAVGGHPYRQPAHMWQPPAPIGSLLAGAAFAARTRRTVLRDSISSHAVVKPIFCISNLAQIPLLGNLVGASHA